MDLERYICGITPPNRAYEKKMEGYIDGLTKPVGSLGRLEEMVIRLAGIQETMTIETSPKVSVIMCADNGVCVQGVSSCPQEVTATVTTNFTRGITAMNRLSHFANAKMHVVDIGVMTAIEVEGVKRRKIMMGTNDMTKEMAIGHDKVYQAIQVGIEETTQLIEEGYQIFGTGEMGIGNTTTSAAVTAVLLDREVEVVTGKGAGAKDDVYTRKVEAIKTAIKINAPDKEDAIDTLAKVGGLDLCGLVGVFLACSYHKKLVVIDGFISATAALVAYKLNPIVKDYMLASHKSYESGMGIILDHMGLEPHFDLRMRLGEGSGCPICFNLIDMACHTLLTMGTFEDAHVDRTAYENIWK